MVQHRITAKDYSNETLTAPIIGGTNTVATTKPPTVVHWAPGFAKRENCGPYQYGLRKNPDNAESKLTSLRNQGFPTWFFSPPAKLNRH